MPKKLLDKATFVFEVVISYGVIGISYVNAQGGLGGGGGPVVIESPFGPGTITDILDRFIGFLVAIAVPITVIMILVGAFQMLTAAGKPEQFRKGTNTIMYAVIGLIVVLISRGLIGLIKQLVTGTAP